MSTSPYILTNRSNKIKQQRLYQNPGERDSLANYLTIKTFYTSVEQDINTAFSVLSSMIFTLPSRYTVTVKEEYIGASTHGIADWDIMEITLNTVNKFDSTYYLDGTPITLNAVVLIHEILHILGYGVGDKWDSLITTRCSTYHGKNGVTQYKNLLRSRGYDVSNINSILLENNFGEGTVNAHLEEGLNDSFQLESGIMNGVDHPALVNELMSGFLDGQDVITTVTLGILEDLGAKVNYASKFVNNASRYLVIQSEYGAPVIGNSFTIKGHTFTGNDDFRVAISEWLADESSAAKKYGRIQHWNTVNVTDMSQLFMNQTQFNENILDWNVSNVLSMREMFKGAEAFNHDIREWTVPSVMITSHMLVGATMMNSNPLWTSDPGYGNSPRISFFDNKILGYYRETAIDIYVSAGELNFSTPYRLYLDPEGTIELPGNKLYLSATYRFHRLRSATTHPFYISDASDFRALVTTNPSSKLVFGGSGNAYQGIVGNETFTLRFPRDGEERMMSTDTLFFYCTTHSHLMYSTFSLSHYESTLIFTEKDYKEGIMYYPDYISNDYADIKSYVCSSVPSISSLFDGNIQIKESEMTSEEDVRPGTIYIAPGANVSKEESYTIRVNNSINSSLLITLQTTFSYQPVAVPDENIVITIDTGSDTQTVATAKKKILCLHGGGGSSAGFREQKGMNDLLTSSELSGYEFLFLDSPYPSGVWYQDPPGGKNSPTLNPDWASVSISHITKYIADNGPFHGILGYSQGAAMAIVYLAYTDTSFERVLLFNGYIPNTHKGLVNTIVQASPMSESPLVFLATNDPFYESGTEIQTQNVFENEYQVISSQAGHSLPTKEDSTFANVVEYILTGSTAQSLTFQTQPIQWFPSEKESDSQTDKKKEEEEKRVPGYWFDTAYSKMISGLNLNFTINIGNTKTNNGQKKLVKKMPVNFQMK